MDQLNPYSEVFVVNKEVLDVNNQVERYVFEAAQEKLIVVKTAHVTIYDLWHPGDLTPKDSLAFEHLHQLLKEEPKIKACILPASWTAALQSPFTIEAERYKLALSTVSSDIPTDFTEPYQLGPFIEDTEQLSHLLLDSDSSLKKLLDAKRVILEMQDQYFGSIMTSSQCLYHHNELIGACSYTKLFDQPLLCHYFIASRFQKRGLAQALLAHCSLATKKLGFDEVIASVDAKNTGSIRTLQKVGFEHYGSQKYQVVIMGG